LDAEQPFRPLQKPPFREADAAPLADDQVVDHADVDQGERVPETGRDQFVGPARFGDPGGVVVDLMCP